MSATQKVVHDHDRLLSIYAISPSPENALLYKPVTPDDEDTIKMAKSIRELGILEPLVVSADYYILSGHRRHCAARIAGLKELPCKVSHVRRGDGETASDEFLKLLREHNRQRIKSRDELLREAIVSIDPLKAHRALTAYRKRKSKIKVATIEIRETQRRKEISSAKQALLAAVQRVIFALQEFWPLTLRQIHYQLLNDPPLIHSAKPGSRYRNDKRCYAALIDLVTRARHEDYIDYEVIHDPTRPVTIWNVHPNLSGYYAQEMEDMLNGYWRDLMQSQPNHIEIVVEKNTLQNIVHPVAEKFCIALSSGRGQNTTRPMYDIAERYKASGKEKLIILAASDLDPDGDAIAHSLGQRLRDDFRIPNVDVIKCALTMEQVRKLRLPNKYERAKIRSSNYDRYIDAYKTDFVWELEALDPKVLQRLLTNAIDQVIDRRAFNAEIKQERADAVHLAAVREIVLKTLQPQITGSRA
jgi:hypothetical protein